MKIATLILFLSLNIFCNAQNPSFRIIFENIYPIISTDYTRAKQMFIDLEKNHIIDPAEKLLFLYESLRNDDISYFKSEIKGLMENSGYRYSKIERSFDDNLTLLINEKGLEEWIFSQSDSLYPIWVKNNPRAFEIRKKIDELIIRDQMRGFVYYQDSACNLGQELKKLDLSNFYDLMSLVDKNGILPNHIDHGLGTYYTWQIILLHNLYSDRFYEIWERILPYIEKTYFAGKIGDDLFRLYDQCMARQFGYQYYGFEKNIPIKDEEHLAERKRKYGFGL